jgi:head-tail adaptor
MRAGARNTLATVYRLKRTAEKDGNGNIDQTEATNWEIATEVGDSGRLWVGIADRGSREFIRGEQFAAEITHQVTCLYAAGKRLKTGMRFVFGGRTVNIAGPPVNLMQKNAELVFPGAEPIEG